MDRTNYEFVGDLYQLFQLRAEAPRNIFDAVYRVMMKDLRAHPDAGGGGSSEEVEPGYGDHPRSQREGPIR